MSRSDMASPSKIASIFGTLLLGISLSEASQINVTIGQSALLHCVVAPPPPPQTTRVYWQTDATVPKVVHFVNMGKEELHYQALPYKHRTALDLHQLLAGNYSLVLKNVTKEDNQTTIRCLYSANRGAPIEVSRTTLTVLDRPNKPVSENNSDKSEESDPESFPVWATVLTCILALLLLVACVTGVICRVFHGKKAELSSDTGSEASGGVDHVPVEMAEENEKSALNGAQKSMDERSDTV